MTEELKGRDFRARRRLSDARDVTLADVWELCAKVPVESLAPLLASGHIEPAVLPSRRRDDGDEAPV